MKVGAISIIPGMSGTKDDREFFIRVCINNLCSLSSKSTDAFVSTAGRSRLLAESIK